MSTSKCAKRKRLIETWLMQQTPIQPNKTDNNNLNKLNDIIPAVVSSRKQSEGVCLSELSDPYWVLWGIVECFEDLRHLPSGPEVHPEAGHGTARRQADHTEETTRHAQHQQTVKSIS